MGEVDARPFPPGDYPLVVVGSGPGGLQVSYSLRRLGVEHALISADEAPGGMFRRFPFFQRLLSWTKPYAPVPRGSRAYERYDWNSLHRRGAVAPGDPARVHGRHLGVPVAAGDGGQARRVRAAGRPADPLRLPLDRRPGAGWRRRFVLETTDGEYRCRRRRLRGRRRGAVHARDARARARGPLRRHPDAETYAGRRALHHRQAELRLRAGQRAPATGRSRIVLASPRPAQAVGRDALAGRASGRATCSRIEDHVLGGGV